MYHRPHWSYSAITQYLSCPLRFYFQRVARLPQTSVGSGLVMGSSVHAALAEYHRTVQQDEPTDAAKLHQIFTDTWDRREAECPVAYKSNENPDELKAQGISLIEMYLKEPPPQNIIGIEEEIVAPLHNSKGEYLETPLLAIADLITEDNEEVTVREFKTSGRSYSEMEVETSLQPTAYVNAVKEALGQHPTVEYTILVKTKTPKVQRLTTVRSDDDLARLGDLVESIERATQAGVFYPIETPLNCSTCPYRQPCREWGRTETSRRIPLNIPEAVPC
jgi:CRISPR/Cas system-associated exonuclease Cas4 (RecB family)